MKINLLKIIALLMIFCGGFSSCAKDKDNVLTGTKWKLIGIVDFQSKEIKVLEGALFHEIPVAFERYKLMFDTDSAFTTHSHTNVLRGVYRADNSKHTIHMVIMGGTMAGEGGDGDLYCDALEDAKSFFIRKNELLIFFNDNKNYLLFKLVKK